MWKSLRKRNHKFDLSDDFNHQKSEVFNLVLNEPNVVEFELMMAVAARKVNTQYLYLPAESAYLPTPTLYCDVTAADVDQFFERIAHVTSFVKELSDVSEILASARRARYHYSAMQRLVKEGSHKVFLTLLHFTLFTNPMRLVEVKAAWHQSLAMQQVKVFTYSYSREANSTFQRRGRYRHFLFHGTWEHNLYSILRNGIKAYHNRQVFMSNDMGYSMGYARSINKVFICFEVRTDISYSQQVSTGQWSPLLHCCFPSTQIRIRAVIWIAAGDQAHAKQVAANLIKDLKKRNWSEAIVQVFAS